ncbi:MAG: helix-turn-helix domain-containing protein [Blautia sp.]|nr:helix-turn-helix domain-containing protein [Blautia sp.]
MGGNMEYSRREKVKVEFLNNQKESEHFHQDIEMIYVLEGELSVSVGDVISKMKAEDILVINANKRHSLSGSPDVLYVKLSVAYQMVSDLYQNAYVIYWCDSTKSENEHYAALRQHLKELIRHYMENRGATSNFGHIALCYRVMDTLSMYFMVNADDKETRDDKDKFEDRIAQINNYIRANYSRAISLKELSEQLYLSNGYLSRFFKKNYGMSFVEYLTNVRLFHAVDEILYTSIPVTRIAYDNGFPSVAVFNKAFKKVYGETPSAYRKKAKKQKEEDPGKTDETLIENRLEKLLNVTETETENRETLEKENVFSVKEYSYMKNYWGNMMSFGSSVDLLRSEIRQDILRLKETIDFKYVRVWNPFLPEMYIDVDDPEGKYNFSRLDSILDFLLQNGMKPHIELGAKPRVLSYAVSMSVDTDDKDADFMGMERWERVLGAMMKHLAHRYGRAEMDTWRLELWYQESKWGKEGSDELYYDMFNTVYEVARAYSEGIQIGGYGIRLDFQVESRKEFFRRWQQQKYTPDYLSILYYPYDRGEFDEDIYSKRSTDSDNMMHWLRREQQLLQEVGMGELPLFITEWNLTISDRNYMNDICYKGAYIVKNVIDMYGMVEDMAYFAASDRSSEYYDSNALFHGGRGLITKEGVMKPAGYAFGFLNNLYQYCIGKGENFLITTDCHDSYAMICHNQQTLGYTYFLTKEHELQRDKMWKYFSEREEVEQKIRLTDVQDGQYQIKVRRVNDQNGCAFNLWEEMEFEQELSRGDIRYFDMACEPRLSIYRKEATGGELELNITMKPNEIAIVKIRHMVD